MMETKNLENDVQQNLIYEGKAKKLFTIPGDEKNIRLEFKDSLTAFNAQKLGSFKDKGAVNRDIASFVFKYLRGKNILSHWVRDEDRTVMIVKKVGIIPLEVVVRNVLAGSTAQKLGIAEGTVMKRPLVEFYFKKDELQDPFVSDDQVLMLELATEKEIKQLKDMALMINSELIQMFLDIGIRLIDFKVEFGRDEHGKIILADEITPDCCRLWDIETNEKMDKDRFRRDLGKIEESYNEILNRLRNRITLN